MKYRAMTKKPWLFVPAVVLLLIGMFFFFSVFIPWVQEDHSGDPYFVHKIIGYGLVYSISFALYSELFMVAIGHYQNQYTGSRFFKGILY